MDLTEYLKEHAIKDPVIRSRSSSPSSDKRHEVSSSPSHPLAIEEKAQPDYTSPMSSPPEFSIKMVASPSDSTDTSKELGSKATLDKHNSVASDTYLPPSDSEDDLSIVTKDSLEELSSTVPRSPRSPRFQALADDSKDEHPLNATSSPMEAPRSPRRKLKKKLTINLNGAEFDLEKKRRPMSPFTSGGMLRKFVPPSAPAVVTEFGPSIREEMEAKESSDAQATMSQEILPMKTTRAERGGKGLMGFLSRRVATK